MVARRARETHRLQTQLAAGQQHRDLQRLPVLPRPHRSHPLLTRRPLKSSASGRMGPIRNLNKRLVKQLSVSDGRFCQARTIKPLQLTEALAITFSQTANSNRPSRPQHRHRLGPAQLNRGDSTSQSHGRAYGGAAREADPAIVAFLIETHAIPGVWF